MGPPSNRSQPARIDLIDYNIFLIRIKCCHNIFYSLNVLRKKIVLYASDWSVNISHIPYALVDRWISNTRFLARESGLIVMYAFILFIHRQNLFIFYGSRQNKRIYTLTSVSETGIKGLSGISCQRARVPNCLERVPPQFPIEGLFVWGALGRQQWLKLGWGH